MVSELKEKKLTSIDNIEIQKIVNSCYQCGKCSGVCPVSKIMDFFSPRYIASEFLSDEKRNTKIWDCLTCDRCTAACPQGVKFADFILDCRIQARELNEETHLNEAHFGYFQSLNRLQANENIVPNKLEVLPKNVKISKPGESEIMYFIGCSPVSFLEQHHYNVGVDYRLIPEATIRILNQVNIKPVILSNEKCCGHDSLLSGDLSTFKKLSEHNIKIIEDAGIEQVIISCAEGLKTFSKDYPRFVRKPKFKVVSFTEFMADQIKNGNFKFPYPYERTVTFHDPCRMGRQMGIYDSPREILKSIDGVTLVEMENNREKAQCCGINGWNNCNAQTKYLRNIRLEEAEATGADTLVTTCPKCQMHFNCLKNETKLHGYHKFKIDILDLTVFMAKALYLL